MQFKKITFIILILFILYISFRFSYDYYKRCSSLFCLVKENWDRAIQCNHSFISAEALSLRQISSCSDRATERGYGQRVVSFSFYGDESLQLYFRGIKENAILVSKKYPGWMMRVYFVRDPKNITLKKVFDALEGRFPHLDFCNVAEITGHGNLTTIFGRLWRFLPMSDPLVDTFISRDLDSRIIDREVAAVEEWLQSNLTFHVMRDHPEHNQKILAGMWGTRVKNNRPLMYSILAKILQCGKNIDQPSLDQMLLANYVWPYTDGDGIHHDSFYCTSIKHNFWRPWPKRRQDMIFVGSPVATEPQRLTTICPYECRRYSNWMYC